MTNPHININLDKIEHNAGLIAGNCSSKGIITKAVCGNPHIVNAFIKAGIKELADSRIENIKKLRSAGFSCQIALLRIPMISEAKDAVRYADCSYQSEIKVIEEFDRQAGEMGRIHRVILMVEIGDLREGIMPDELSKLVDKVVNMNNIKLEGLATNVGCFGGVLPSYENTSMLVELQKNMEREFDLELPVLSGGNSSALELIGEGLLPESMNFGLEKPFFSEPEPQPAVI